MVMADCEGRQKRGTAKAYKNTRNAIFRKYEEEPLVKEERWRGGPYPYHRDFIRGKAEEKGNMS